MPRNVALETFRNPFVKERVFEIKFPNLFYIENHIGDFQLKILDKFPESSMLIRRQIIMADLASNSNVDKVPNAGEPTKKFWQFKSDLAILNVSSNSLDISSNNIKSFFSNSHEGFKDLVDFVLKQFFELTSLSVLKRIGLRYVNHCPIPEKTNSAFRSLYNTTLPIQRFDIENVDEMFFRGVTKTNSHKVIYQEQIQKHNGKDILVLDLDAFKDEVPVEKYQEELENLHNSIREQFKLTMNRGAFTLLRGGEKK